MEGAMSGIDDILGGASGFLLEGSSFNPLELGSWTLVFWTAVTFFLLLFLLGRFAWRPLMDTVKGREERIASDIEKAEAARKNAEETQEMHRRELEQAAQQAKKLLDEARERAKGLEADLEAKAREEAGALVERARQSIEAEKQQALREIKDQVVDLSVAISARIAERPVDREDHLRTADALMAQLKESL
jgi:F-type H+-transporting ATPase subunit b